MKKKVAAHRPTSEKDLKDVIVTETNPAIIAIVSLSA
jgi:hypothetical protein